MAEEYYQSSYTGAQIDNAVGRIVNGEIDQLASSAASSASAAQSAYTGVQNALNNLPEGDTLIINDLTTGGTKAALSAEQGKVLGQRPFHNTNLLDNWFFAEPINQRGQTEYTITANYQYNIDRWWGYRSGSIVRISENGLIVTASESGYTSLAQQIDTPLAQLAGKTVAVTLLTDRGLASKVVNIPVDGNNSTFGTATTDYGSVQFRHSTERGVFLELRVGTGNTVTLIAAKVEIGSEQTLAHQDASGNWVLNDPPPDKGMELLKCIQSTADKNDSYANKMVFHTGNKPSGSYTGNGDATDRTIETGGIGEVIIIYSGNGVEIVTRRDRAEASFANGTLTIASATNTLSASSVTYYYQVL